MTGRVPTPAYLGPMLVAFVFVALGVIVLAQGQAPPAPGTTGTITGRVLDREGSPVEGARVTALRRAAPGPGGLLVPAVGGSDATTDDRGQYRLFALRPGEYYITASPIAPMRAPGIQTSDGEPKPGDAPTFYPSSAAVDGAKTVTVRAGQDTANIDVSLVRVMLGRVSGRATDASGNPLSAAQAFVSLFPSGDLTTAAAVGSVTRFADGAFAIANVPLGRYFLSVSTTAGAGVGGGREAAFVPVTVVGDEVVQDVRTNGGASVAGRVVIEGSMPERRLWTPESTQKYRAKVSARTREPRTPAAVTAVGTAVNVGDDLRFHLPGLRGSVVLQATGPRITLSSITWAGEDILAKGLYLAGTERLDDVTITMTTDVGVIEGTVKTATGEPAEAWVVVFPEDSSKWFTGSPWVHVVRSRGRSGSAPRPGTFLSAGLLPGRYVVALAQMEAAPSSTSPRTDRESLEQVRAGAKTVKAEAGKRATVELRLPR